MVSPEVASHFGVFFSPRESRGEVAFFLQKPSPEKVREFAATHACFVDTGLWLLSRRVIGLLMGRCGWTGEGFSNGCATNYELLLAKDEGAGSRIREHLAARPPNPRARFVDYSISPSGLQITRS